MPSTNIQLEFFKSAEKWNKSEGASLKQITDSQ